MGSILGFPYLGKTWGRSFKRAGRGCGHYAMECRVLGGDQASLERVRSVPWGIQGPRFFSLSVFEVLLKRFYKIQRAIASRCRVYKVQSGPRAWDRRSHVDVKSMGDPKPKTQNP